MQGDEPAWPFGPCHLKLEWAAPLMAARSHIVICDELETAIDELVGRRGRSNFLAEAAWREIRRLRQLRALERAAGVWKDNEHPELKQGAARWVAKLRRESEKRFRRLSTAVR